MDLTIGVPLLTVGRLPLRWFPAQVALLTSQTTALTIYTRLGDDMFEY